MSSTLAELAEERAAVARAISSLRLTPPSCSPGFADVLDPAMFKGAFAAGSQVSRRDAVAIVRHNGSP